MNEIKIRGHDENQGEFTDSLIKRSLFNAFYLIINYNICKNIIFIIILIIEVCTHILYLYLSFYRITGTNDAYLTIVAKYLDFSSIIQDSKIFFLLYLVSLIITTLFVFLFLIFLSQVYFFQKAKFTQILLAKILSIYYIMIYHIFFMPILIAFLDNLSCNINLDHTSYNIAYMGCYSGLHIGFIIFTLIILVLFLIIIFFFLIYFQDIAPDSNLPWANQSNSYIFIKFAKKLVIILFTFIAHYNISGNYLVFVLLFLLNFFSVNEISSQYFMNDSMIHFTMLYAGSFFGFITIILGISSIIRFLILQDLYLILLIPVYFVVNSFIFNYFNISKFSLINIPHFNSTIELSNYVNLFLKASSYSTRFDYIKLLKDSIGNNIKICKTQNCMCDSLFNQSSNERMIDPESESYCLKKENVSRKVSTNKVSINIAKQLNISITDKLKIEFINKEKIYDFLINSVILKFLEEKGKKPSALLILSYINFVYKDKNILAIYYLKEMQENKPTLSEEFQGFRLIKRIEEDLVNRVKIDNTIENLSKVDINVIKLIYFDEKLSELKHEMNESLEMYISFWKEIIEDSPNFSYINKLGYKTSQEIQVIREIYNNLVSNFPNNLYFRVLYALFQKNVEKDEYHSYETYTALLEVQSNIGIGNKLEEQKEKYGLNSLATIIIISAKKGNIGEILKTNNEISELLGYDPSEIVSSNISKLIPLSIAEKHDEIIEEFIFRSNKNRQADEKEKIVFALHKDGTILPITIIHRIVPNLNFNAQLIGFLLACDSLAEFRYGEDRSRNNEIAILLADENYNLVGINSLAAEVFGIDTKSCNLRKYFSSEDVLNLSKVILNIETKEVEEKMKTEEGYSANIDLEFIRRELDAEMDIIQDLQISQNIEMEDNLPQQTSGIKAPLPDIPRKAKRFQDISSYKSLNYLDCNIKCVEQIYGINVFHNEKGIKGITNRVITLKFADILHLQAGGIPDTVKNKQEDEEEEDNDKNLEYLWAEIASQSQSSSSTSDVFAQSRFIKEFKAKIHEMKDPFFLKCLFYVGFILFLVLLAMGIVDYSLRKNIYSNTQNYINQTISGFRLSRQLLEIPLYSRILFNIHSNIESSTQNQLSNRTGFYISLISNITEETRQMMTFLIDKNIILKDELIYLYMFSKMDDLIVMNNSTFTYQKAIASYLTSLTSLYNVPQDTFLYTTVWNDSYKNSMNVLENFTIENGKYPIRIFTNKSASYLQSFTSENFENNKNYSYISPSIACGFIIIITIILLPYIMVIQKNVLKIFNTIFEINHFLIVQYIEICNDFASHLRSSNKELTQAFEKENFADLLKKEDEIEDGKGQKNAARRFQKPFKNKLSQGNDILKNVQGISKGTRNNISQNYNETTGNVMNRGSYAKQKMQINENGKTGKNGKNEKNDNLNTEDLENNAEEFGISGEEPDELLEEEFSGQNQTISKEIKKTYTEISNSKRQSYFIRLSILIGYFGIYLGLHGYSLPIVFNQISLFIKTTSILNNKQSFLLQLMLFQREEIILDKLMVYNQYNLVTNSIEDALESQKQVLLLSQNLTDNTLNSFLNSIDLDACKYIQQKNLSGNTIAPCESYYNEILTHGLGNAIAMLITAYRSSHFRYTKIPYSSKDDQIAKEISNVDSIQLIDLFALYLRTAFNYIEEFFKEAITSYFNSIMLIETLCFSLFIIFLIILFFVVWINLLNNLKLDILKAKGVLNLLPTNYLSNDKEFLKSINNSSIFN